MTKDKEKSNTVNVQAYKFNGTLYRQWNTAKIIQNTAKHLILNLKWTKVKSDKAHWVVKDPTLWIFPKNKFYNALIRFKGNEVNIYINLASSFIFEDNTVKYIDYDLDLKICPMKSVKLLDVSEFFTNSLKMKYSHKLKDVLIHQVNELVKDNLKNKYIFDKEVVFNYLKLAEMKK
ncbi:DUF402 domain-containing protein [Mycoplasma sp. 1654_15]|uniref:DUF402 domain-containing protein n=1 Tax=Mycoplasma sp. 1654_15 TaxID=2725994 RepID=UPI001448E5A3|nr:DUF402 domain-containing protein [Mycoplasma sp. 1654_15]QJB71236.1 DUF402 domain-containing protein [Mycoplasma sp. 1654_15]